jgi:hypothetical protein
MGPIFSDKVLRDEANAIHPGPPIGATTGGAALYRALHERNSSALCLSGGGIRSASFALGVIEALAVHPRQASAAGQGEKQAESPEKAFLAQFNYLSTVSGGGYIGSWLSAWIARAGFAEVWKKLTGHRAHPDEEPGEIAWLRAYSNYLTPALGLFSADTWTAIALYMRNMFLNWFVILPALCILLFTIKIGTIFAFEASQHQSWLPWIGGAGLLLMIWAIRFGMRNRPTCAGQPILGKDPPAVNSTKDATQAHRNERTSAWDGAGQPAFIWLCFIPSIVAANFLSLYLLSDDVAKLLTAHLTSLLPGLASIFAMPAEGPTLWHLFKCGVAGGILLYAVSWLIAFPFTGAKEKQSSIYWLRDFLCWAIGAGGVFGALIGVGVYLLLKMTSTDAPILLLGYLLITLPTTKVLLLCIFGVPWVINAQLTAEMIFVGLSSWQRGSDADREWFGRSTGWLAAAAIVWLFVAYLILAGAAIAWVFLLGHWAKMWAAIVSFVTSGGIATWLGQSGKSGATEQRDKKTSLTVKIVLAVAPPIFLILLVVGISVLKDYLLFDRALIFSHLVGGVFGDQSEDWKWLGIGVGATLLVALFAWLCVNINRFSIHALYRNRLMRAYLGASNPVRKPNPFTGFDEFDNVRMTWLWKTGKGAEGWQPFHVVNMALNVVASSRLAWQERMAESFTATPLHCGAATFSGTTEHSLGFRPSNEYGDANGITLGTALAISGAAASPNMGYNSSPMVSLLLALFNVRLGWWLGNPGKPGNSTYRTDGPQIAIAPFLFEMFGQTTDTQRYVYLSDGGHFENLGLYEMIRRRCRCIVVSDAGCDPEYGFEDLGNAVRKIAIDLGVYISFDELKELRARSKDGKIIEGVYYAVGVIDYKTAPEWKDAAGAPPEDGYILYIKPAYHGTESAGIVAYAKQHDTFPHETTGDQFFSESQFESYRTLGFEIADTVFKLAKRKIADIRAGKKWMPDDQKICDMIKALAHKPEISKVPRLSDALKHLDPDDLNELKKILAP